jgi:putative oxygen-independent coproporphyrinogen III oxidase
MPVFDTTGQADGGFGIYVHWPFCLAKCPYCDFNSHVREQIDESGWRDALLAELSYYAGQTGNRTVDSIFFGGGTPSLMSPKSVGAVIEAVGQHWTVGPDTEITLEANPTSVEAGKFAGFADAGVNRLSMGVQSLDDAALQFLGREHSASEALAAFEVARAHFPRISFDLIYGRPDQTLDQWAAELTRAMDLAAGHLSVYQLTIEEGTAFHTAFRQGRLTMPSDDLGADMYMATQDLTRSAGLPAYEISNHARPGDECRHNLVYWRYGDYVGVGPGAHGRITREGQKIATAQRHKPESWIDAVTTKGHGSVEDTVLEPLICAEELLMMGLRLVEGINLHRLSEVAGQPWHQVIDRDACESLVAEGLLVQTADTLRASPSGIVVLNSVTAALLL